MMNERDIAEEQFEAAKRQMTAIAAAALRGNADDEAAADARRAVELARANLASVS